MATIELNGQRVEYFEQGTGAPVVLLHSTGASGSQWRRLAAELSDRFRVIAPDLCGYGGTGPWQGSGEISLAAEAALVAALIERLGEPVHLVGHSFGGAVALRLAQDSPDLLKSLVLIEPVAFHLLRAGDAIDAQAFDEISQVAASVAHALACGDFQGGFGCFVDYWSGDGAWAAVPEEKRGAMASRLGKVALDFWSALNDPARLGDLAELDLPALVIRGETSPLPVRRIAWHLGRTLPRAQLETIERAGHMAPLTHAAEVNALVAAHLQRHATREPRADHWVPATARLRAAA
ncbi:MAG: alpha/beta fold hydrolase [Burkholderiales bacterium]